MKEQRFPPGWDEARVREVLAHYETQTEDEQFAEIEAAREAENTTLVSVPTELVPEVRALLAQEEAGMRVWPESRFSPRVAVRRAESAAPAIVRPEPSSAGRTVEPWGQATGEAFSLEERSRESILAAWRTPLRLDAEINAPPATEEAMARFGSEFGPIPPPFRWFLSCCGGGPVGSEWVDDLASLTETHRRFREEFPSVEGLFAIGWDGRGDPFGIELATGRVLGVDHDNGEIYERAPSFEAFLRRGLVSA